MLLPPLMMRSLLRSLRVKKPSASSVPMSPVQSQPSRMAGAGEAPRRRRRARGGGAWGVARVAGVGQVRAAERGADHGAFALAVDLHEARAHQAQGALDVGGVH